MTRFPDGLREMRLLGKQGLCLLMGVTKERSRSPQGDPDVMHIIPWGSGGGGKIKGKRKVFILAYIVENHSHIDCKYGGVQGRRQQLDPHGMQMKTSR